MAHRLQVKNAEGQWVTAYPVPGAFVCNIGDMLKVWSNGLYQPTMHRVINADPTQSRVSLPFFYEPGYDALVEPPMELLQRLRCDLTRLSNVARNAHVLVAAPACVLHCPGLASLQQSQSTQLSLCCRMQPQEQSVLYGRHLESKVLRNFEL